jgi:hypothetical protein
MRSGLLQVAVERFLDASLEEVAAAFATRAKVLYAQTGKG